MITKRLLTILVVLIFGFWSVFLLPHTSQSSPAGIALVLPNYIGDWIGEEGKVTDRELEVLAKDTQFARKNYINVGWRQDFRFDHPVGRRYDEQHPSSGALPTCARLERGVVRETSAADGERQRAWDDKAAERSHRRVARQIARNSAQRQLLLVCWIHRYDAFASNSVPDSICATACSTATINAGLT